MDAAFSRERSTQLLLAFLAISVPSFCIELFDTYLAASEFFAFNFDRQLILNGEWWRLLSGHFDHLGWAHFLLNALFLAILLLTFSSFGSALFLFGLFCFCSLGISLLIWFFSPELYRYVGLSGGLYSLLAFGLIRDRLYPVWIRYSVLLGLVVKVMYEYMLGSNGQISELIGGPVATDVHLYGLVLGLLSAGLLKFIRF